ncbi:helix-turn-helix domain-containing protein [Duganella radicis]|uniref:Helix-turn-helix domain-containing protein n=1 Tax=Duganella radicis TaxID=551988 RepID=A0A6L6PNH5_9BURK|nr:helix-turn-helix domain-containing protein [Duganella radicis]
MQDYQPAKKRTDISVGESVNAIRKLQNISLGRLAKITHIPVPTLQAIENDALPLDIERAKLLARVLRVHPAVLVFPGWEVED